MHAKIQFDTVQRWMQNVIEHGGTDAEAWHSEAAQKEIPYEEAYLNVNPSETLSPVERIAIYRRMFVLRMCDAMGIDYPGIKHFFGEEKFDEIVMDYVRTYPSNSYTLNHLGRNFPQFISESNLRDKEFLGDLARLELALTNNMDASDSPVLIQQDIASVQPDEWNTATLVPIAALELLEFNYPAAEYLRSVIDEESTEEPIHPKRNAIVVYRKNFTTWFKQLTDEEYVLLYQLCNGATVVQALDILVAQFPDRQKEFEHHVFEWFSDWIQRGMFSKILISKEY